MTGTDKSGACDMTFAADEADVTLTAAAHNVTGLACRHSPRIHEQKQIKSLERLVPSRLHEPHV